MSFIMMEPMLPQQLAECLLGRPQKLLIIDSRSFLEYNDAHVINSVNIGCSKLIKRRLISNKVSIDELLKGTGDIPSKESERVIVYDQDTLDMGSLSKDNFMSVVLNKLMSSFKEVSFLKGGFSFFSQHFPRLCESRSCTLNCGVRTVLSQPCITTEAPTHVLPFLYLGSQEQSTDENFLRSTGIDYVLNISCSCPALPSIENTGRYLRIPVRDTVNENIIEWFQPAFDFIEKVREGHGRVLLHCYAGKSRSATIAIGYIMKHLGLPLDEAYRFVKEKRPGISPNLNFMGQLMQYEKDLHPAEKDNKSSTSEFSTNCGHRRLGSGSSFTELTAPV